MSGNSRRLYLMFLFTAIFLAGIVELFLLRFETGDVYPAYSSLRSDPLGTRAIYESLKALPPMSVERNFRPLDKVGLGPERTLLIAGQDARTLFAGKPWKRLLQNLASDGGRTIISMHPSPSGVSRTDGSGAFIVPETKEESSGEGAGPEDDAPARTAKEGAPWQAHEELGIRCLATSKKDHTPLAQRVGTVPPWALPGAIPWHSPLYFKIEPGAWKILYTWQGNPVVVTRAWGKGTLVMIGDTYLLSNEALRKDRRPEFLAWLTESRSVVFDESHLGLLEQPGMADLAGKYRLQGTAALLVLIALLLIWQQAAYLGSQASSPEDRPDSFTSTGRDTHVGLVNLMQHHIAKEKVLSICLDAWKSGSAAQRFPAPIVTQVQDMVVSSKEGRRDPVSTYRQISKLLEKGKHS